MWELPLPGVKQPTQPVSGDFSSFPSFFLGCGVPLAEITLDLGMEGRRRETPSRGRDLSGGGETTNPELWCHAHSANLASAYRNNIVPIV